MSFTLLLPDSLSSGPATSLVPWDIVTRITTPLMLLALVVVAWYAWRVHVINSETSRLQSLPEDHRVDLAEKLAAKYGVPVADLSPDARLKIVNRELTARTADRRRLSYIMLGAFCLTAILWFLAEVRPGSGQGKVSAQDSVPAKPAEPARPPAFVSRVQFNVTDSSDSRTLDVQRTTWTLRSDASSTDWPPAFLTVSRLEFGSIDNDGAFLAELTLTNTTSKVILLDLDDRYFSLHDDRGESAKLVYFCCTTRNQRDSSLDPGASRVITLMFTSNSWYGKNVHAHRLFLRVAGLTPVQVAEWAFMPLVTAD